jgi:hypothetical protein
VHDVVGGHIGGDVGKADNVREKYGHHGVAASLQGTQPRRVRV